MKESSEGHITKSASLLQAVLISFILVLFICFLPQSVSLRFHPGGNSQQRDEQQQIWERSVAAACLVDQQEIITRHTHIYRQWDGFTRCKIVIRREANSSWLFTRHCHYLIKRLPAAAPLQADNGNCSCPTSVNTEETVKQTSCLHFKNKTRLGSSAWERVDGRV